MQFLLILMLIFAILVATFALQNAYPVTIYFLKWQFEASFALVVLICLLIGAVAVGSLGLVHQATNRLKTRNKDREKAENSDEVGEASVEILDVADTGGPEEKENVAGGVDDSPQEVEG